MKREEFLARLEQGLAGLGEEEREEALKFYNEYLDEVGPEQEEQEIARLGDPRRVANIIRANLGLGPAPRADGAPDAPETADVPKAAPQQPELVLEGEQKAPPLQPHLEEEPGKQAAPQGQAACGPALGQEDAAGQKAPEGNPEQNAPGQQPENSTTRPGAAPAAQNTMSHVREAAGAAAQAAKDAWKSAQPHVQATAAGAYEAARASVRTGAQNAAAAYDSARNHMGANGVLWLILIILTFPLWIGVLGGLFGALFGLIGGLCGLVLGGFGVILGGLLALVRSLALFATAPADAMMNVGISLLCMALGGALAGIGVAVVQKLVPWVFGLIGRLVKWVSGKVGGGK